MAASLGFIGVGAMGLPMASRLVDAGHAVLVFDVRPQGVDALVARGATSGRSARDVADQCEIVFASLPSNDACEHVVLGTDGVVAGAAMRTFVNLGTHGSQLSRTIADALAARSIVSIDAPVTGGVVGARAGTLTIIVSGPEAVFRRIEPLLACMGGNVFYVGDIVGGAQTMKLANNLLSLAAFVLTGEALAMGVKAGLDPSLMLDVINKGTGRNTATSDKFPRVVLSRTFDLGATTAGAARDIALGLEEAASLGVPMWVSSTVAQFFAFAMSQGEAKQDYSTLVRHFERWAGVEISRKADP